MRSNSTFKLKDILKNFKSVTENFPNSMFDRIIPWRIQLAYFLDLGPKTPKTPKTILFHPQNAISHSHCNYYGSADPQDSDLNQWLSSRKYAVEF